MKIYYKKKTLRLNLILGIVWLSLAILQLSIQDNMNWIAYGWFILAILYFAQYFHQNRNKYLSIENGVIKENWLFGKSLKLDNIHTIKHFAGEYILKTDSKELRIQIPLIENDSLLKLSEKLSELNAEWN
jgi:hypothetical protein